MPVLRIMGHVNPQNNGNQNVGIGNGANPTPAIQVQTPNQFTFVRDRLFGALFYRLAAIYARTVHPSIRRLLECCILIEAFVMMGILIYIHVLYAKRPITCLRSIKDHWPRDGVLRVELINNSSNVIQNYTLYQSYAKEYNRHELDEFMRVVNGSFEIDKLKKLNVSHGELEGNSSQFNKTDYNLTVDSNSSSTTNSTYGIDLTSVYHHESKPGVEKVDENEKQANLSELEEDIFMEDGGSHGSFTPPFLPFFGEALDIFSELQMLAKTVFPEEKYIVEYALEFGFLRLSPKTRARLNITVMLVILDPLNDQCLAQRDELAADTGIVNWINHWLLEEFVGYQDLLMSNIKYLAEQENNKGYVRNVVTGEHFRFVSISMHRGSYITAFLVMLIFTLSMSMLLRYSHNQIFIFIVELLQMLELNVIIAFPAAPLLTVILALVGMEAIMSEFFNDTTTAFYVILTVWMADQFHAICCHTVTSKRHWLRYFFLYHFAFYAYHYRFHGQFGWAALLTSWLFILHSMVFFLHHYELPAALLAQQHQQQQATDTTNAHSEHVDGHTEDEDEVEDDNHDSALPSSDSGEVHVDREENHAELVSSSTEERTSNSDEQTGAGVTDTSQASFLSSSHQQEFSSTTVDDTGSLSEDQIDRTLNPSSANETT